MKEANTRLKSEARFNVDARPRHRGRRARFSLDVSSRRMMHWRSITTLE